MECVDPKRRQRFRDRNATSPDEVMPAALRRLAGSTVEKNSKGDFLKIRKKNAGRHCGQGDRDGISDTTPTGIILSSPGHVLQS